MKTALELALEKLEAMEWICKPQSPFGGGVGCWEQPDRREIEVDANHAMMSESAFAKLAEYSCSWPTGAWPGKMWKAGPYKFRRADYIRSGFTTEQAATKFPEVWYLRWYGMHATDPENFVSNHQRVIIVVQENGHERRN